MENTKVSQLLRFKDYNQSMNWLTINNIDINRKLEIEIDGIIYNSPLDVMHAFEE